MKPFIRRAGLLAMALAVHLGAQSPLSEAGPNDRPVQKRFNWAITFYLSFDKTPRADLAGGSPDPLSVAGDAQFHPGLHGRAMALTDATKPGTYVVVGYPTLDNVDVTKPGSLAVWLRPHHWDRGVKAEYFWPVKIMSSGVQLMFGRMGGQPNEPIYLWAKVGDTKDVCLIAGDTRDWKEGEWHLWVMNWRSQSIEFSVDGGPCQRQDLPAKINAEGDRTGQIYLGQGGASCRYLLDELMVLDRPLANEEIQRIYAEGMKRQAVPPPQVQKTNP